MQAQTLSIVIPVYNEEKTIEKVMEMVVGADIGSLQKEIILVDDGSTDGTQEILKKYEGVYTVLYQEKNYGKSAALKKGFLSSRGDLVVVQDADMEYDPQDYALLLEPFERGKADVVYGSRFRGGRPSRMIYYQNQLANRLLTMLSNIFTGYNLTDVETGYKMFRGELIREIAPTLESQRFGFEIEITARIAKTKARVYEVGIAYYGRSKEEGKHITIADGLLAVWEIFKYNLFR
jgi:glycosyltransferase involved in cell wall biosynthesis